MLMPFLTKLMNYEHLSEVETKLFFDAIVHVENPIQVGTALALLHAKGETIIELETLLRITKKSMLSIDTDFSVLDIVGTGGDKSNTFNISTASCFLAAACGVKVVKHGNRAISSHCGAADILEGFGLDLLLAKQQMLQTLSQFNFAFCFAPLFHPMLKRFSDIRRQLQLPTFFNLLGPLLNPASPNCLILGVKNQEMIERYLALVKTLSIKRALIVHNFGMDEISCVGVNKILDLNQGEVHYFEVDPKKYDLKICSVQSLQAFSLHQSMGKFETSLTNINSPEAHTIILNAALALYVTGNCSSIEDGIVLAKQKIEFGSAMNLFQQYVKSCSMSSSNGMTT